MDDELFFFLFSPPVDIFLTHYFLNSLTKLLVETLNFWFEMIDSQGRQPYSISTAREL